MLITDSYLGNRFNGQQIAADAYDDFLKKKGGAAVRSAGAPPTKRQQKKAGRAQKKELKKQGLAPKKGPFKKLKAAATGINSPAAKKTGLFGIKKKINPILAKLKKPIAPAPAPAPIDAAEASAELNEAETPLPDNQAEALADGASTDLGEISDKTPAAEPETPAEAESSTPAEPLPEPGSEEEQFYAYDLEQWPRGRARRRSNSYDSFDEPKEGEKKSADKKKGISVGAVFGLLGAVAAGAIAMYVVMSAGEKTGEPELNLKRVY